MATQTASSRSYAPTKGTFWSSGAGGFIAATWAVLPEKGFTASARSTRSARRSGTSANQASRASAGRSLEENCRRACEGARGLQPGLRHGGHGLHLAVPAFECDRSFITPHVEAAWRAGVRRYFFSSSACAYNTLLQQDPKVRALKESDAYPAMAERGYGWEKLISEQFCQEYWHERGLKTFIARFHNVYGPHGTWDGGREKAPAAICRKVIEAIDTQDLGIVIWAPASGHGLHVRRRLREGIDLSRLRRPDRHARQSRLERAGLHHALVSKISASGRETEARTISTRRCVADETRTTPSSSRS